MYFSRRMIPGHPLAWAMVGAICLAGAGSIFGQDAYRSPAAREAPENDVYRRGTWEFGLESTYSFQVVRFPTRWFIHYAGRQINPINYNFATQMLSARYRLTGVGGPWLLRGSLQSSVSIVGTAILSGPETYFAGLALGLHYDFVQPRARLVPYLELRGGPGATDADGRIYAQQQDLTFTYILSAGLRYDLNAKWTVTLSAVDQHLSNFFLADRNYGVDSAGISLGVLKRF